MDRRTEMAEFLEDRSEPVTDFDVQPPPFPKFPPEGLFPRLRGLSPPAGEFPEAAQKPPFGPSADEDPPFSV